MNWMIFISLAACLSINCSIAANNETDCYAHYIKSGDKIFLDCAIKLYTEKVTDEGGEENKLRLAALYYDSGDTLKSIKLYEQVREKYQSADAEYSLAQIYYSGNEVVEKDYFKVVQLLEEASSKGLAQAQLELSYMYSTYLEDKNYKKAISYLYKAANNDSKDAEGYVVEPVIKAQLLLGKIYRDGEWGEAKDLDKAKYWVSKASSNMSNKMYGIK